MPLDPQLDSVFDAAGRQFNVDPTLLKALTLTESSGRPNAVSPAGAQGLTQLMPGTAQEVGVSNPFDPTQAIYGGAKYLAQGLDKYGDPVKALMYYHGGPDETQWGVKTQGYPKTVASYYGQLRGNGKSMEGIDALAAVGQPALNGPPTGIAGQANPQMAQAQPGGMSDEDILNGLATGRLPMPPGLAGPTPPPPQTSSQPGGLQQFGPEDQAWAREQSQLHSALGRQTPAWISDLAKLGVAQPLAAQTKAGENLQTVGPNGVVSNMPGAVGSAAEKEAAIAGGKAAGALPFVAPTEAAKESQKITISRDGAIYRGSEYIGHAPKQTTVTDPQGNEYTAFTPPMTVGGAQGQQPPANAASPGASSNPNVPTPPAGAVMGSPSKLGPGETEALKMRGEEEQKQRQVVINEANQAQRDAATIQNMVSEEGKFVSGPFAEHAQEAARYLRLIDPSYNGQVASYEDYLKNSGNLVRQAVRETSGRAAVQEFNMIANTLPTPETSPQGRLRVQNELLGLSDYRVAKGQAQQQWEAAHGGPGRVTDFETTFQKQASPYAFIVTRMDPQTRQELIGKLQGSEEGRKELGRLRDQIKFIGQSGILP
jgi:hypothetical protein